MKSSARSHYTTCHFSKKKKKHEIKYIGFLKKIIYLVVNESHTKEV